MKAAEFNKLARKCKNLSPTTIDMAREWLVNARSHRDIAAQFGVAHQRVGQSVDAVLSGGHADHASNRLRLKIEAIIRSSKMDNGLPQALLVAIEETYARFSK